MSEITQRLSMSARTVKTFADDVERDLLGARNAIADLTVQRDNAVAAMEEANAARDEANEKNKRLEADLKDMTASHETESKARRALERAIDALEARETIDYEDDAAEYSNKAASAQRSLMREINELKTKFVTTDKIRSDLEHKMSWQKMADLPQSGWVLVWQMLRNDPNHGNIDIVMVDDALRENARARYWMFVPDPPKSTAK